MVEAQRLGESGEWWFLWLYLFGSMVAGLLSKAPRGTRSLVAFRPSV